MQTAPVMPLVVGGATTLSFTVLHAIATTPPHILTTAMAVLVGTPAALGAFAVAVWAAPRVASLGLRGSLAAGVVVVVAAEAAAAFGRSVAASQIEASLAAGASTEVGVSVLVLGIASAGLVPAVGGGAAGLVAGVWRQAHRAQ